MNVLLETKKELVHKLLAKLLKTQNRPVVTAQQPRLHTSSVWWVLWPVMEFQVRAKLVSLWPKKTFVVHTWHQILGESCKEGSRLKRISLVRFFKTFQEHLAYALLGLFISLLRFLYLANVIFGLFISLLQF